MSEDERFPPATSADLDHEHRELLRSGLDAAQSLAAKYGGAAGDLPPLAALDDIYESWRARAAGEREPVREVLHALGAALGEHLARIPGLEWTVVTDAEGADLAVYGREGEMLVYPFIVVRRRLEDGIALEARALVAEIEQRWRELREALADDS